MRGEPRNLEETHGRPFDDTATSVVHVVERPPLYSALEVTVESKAVTRNGQFWSCRFALPRSHSPLLTFSIHYFYINFICALKTLFFAINLPLFILLLHSGGSGSSPPFRSFRCIIDVATMATQLPAFWRFSRLPVVARLAVGCRLWTEAVLCYSYS